MGTKEGIVEGSLERQETACIVFKLAGVHQTDKVKKGSQGSLNKSFYKDIKYMAYL